MSGWPLPAYVGDDAPAASLQGKAQEFDVKAAASIDAYLADIPPDQRAALETLRRQIRAAAPHAEECISYGLPSFRQDGLLVHFGAARRHCAFYPHGVIEAFAERLAAYDTSKGTIRFQPENPMPEALVADIVRYRLAQNAEVAAERAARPRSRKGR
jgi:uncharacterized protein YdhG (YjbR/CyaY superfamily)